MQNILKRKGKNFTYCERIRKNSGNYSKGMWKSDVG